MTAATMQRYFTGLSRNTFLLALTSLFADISTEMLVPILPIFLTQTLKASGSIVGLVEGISGATQNITQGFSGSLSDKLQRRKPIALVGYLLAAIGKPLMGVATIWQGVLAGRFVDRFGATRSLPPPWTRRIAAGRLVSKESVTTREHSWVPYSRSCCSPCISCQSV